MLNLIKLILGFFLPYVLFVQVNAWTDSWYILMLSAVLLFVLGAWILTFLTYSRVIKFLLILLYAIVQFVAIIYNLLFVISQTLSY